MHTLFQDLKFSLRLLAKSPGFTAAAIIVLALGIGVNTAMFSVVDEIVFTPCPFPHGEQVVQLYSQDTKNPKKFRMFSYPSYRDIREQQSVFTGLVAHNLTMVGVGDGENSRRVLAGVVSSNYFSTLQVSLRGRGFLPEEEKPGANAAVTVIGHQLWKRLGSDPAIIGHTLRVNERQFTIVGVAPEGFSGTMMLFGPDLYFPLGVFDQVANDFQTESNRKLERRDSDLLFVVGRLKPGVTQESAAASLATMARSIEKSYPVEFKDQTLITRNLPRLSSSNSPTEEKSLSIMGVLLLGMASIVLLIACLNLANMLLARGTARRKEFAIRLALGGGRARIVRQLLTEGLVLSLAGGALGLLLAVWSADALVTGLSHLAPVTIYFRGVSNPAIFGATLGFCLLATLFFGLAPALKLSRADVLTDLKEQAGEDNSRRRSRFLPRNPLVVLQIALSLGLLVSAGLFIRGAGNAANLDLGFKADDTILVEADASLGGFDQLRSAQLYRALEDRLAALPGVQAASIAATTPFGMTSLDRGVQRFGSKTNKDSHPATAAEGLAFSPSWNSIGADYFTALGLPLRRGRMFTKAETQSSGAPSVVIIDEVLARKLWPDGNALGQRIQWADNDAPRAASDGGAGIGEQQSISAKASEKAGAEIVGIVAAMHVDIFDKDPRGAIYSPFAQGFQSNVAYHLRTAPRNPAGDAALFDTIRREFRQVAAGVPLFTVRTFRQHLDASAPLWILRTAAMIFSVFGVLALGLAVVGIYGVKAYAVARRTREIGIRMALGAAPGSVLRMILREGLIMTLSGVGLGLLIALGLGRALGSLLYDVSPVDPLTFTIAPLVLAFAAMAACWFPARRATRVNPLAALRSE